MDREGRISYVNPAFCAMTGFSESDLIGQHPPFPYWPHDRRDENARLLEQELQGKSPTGGIEVKVMRKDGSVFDARMRTAVPWPRRRAPRFSSMAKRISTPSRAPASSPRNRSSSSPGISTAA